MALGVIRNANIKLLIELLPSGGKASAGNFGVSGVTVQVSPVGVCNPDAIELQRVHGWIIEVDLHVKILAGNRVRK